MIGCDNIIVLALDQATKLTGYSIWVDGQLINYGVFNVEDVKETESRVENTKMFLRAIVDLYKVDRVILEDIQQQSNPKVYKLLAELLGVLTNYLYENKIPYTTVRPSEWRKILKVTGRKRQEQKDSAKELVRSLYNKDTTEDESDAICLGLAVHKKGLDNFVFITED